MGGQPELGLTHDPPAGLERARVPEGVAVGDTRPDDPRGQRERDGRRQAQAAGAHWAAGRPQLARED